MKFILLISLPLYALDQLTKHWVLAHVDPEHAQAAIGGSGDSPPFLSLVNVTNTGAAFGSFKGNNAFFIFISCVALLFVVFLLVRHRQRDMWRDVSLALLLAGILGNLTDRLLHGHVIDFLLFNFGFWPANPWPAFNVADSCICVAVICFIIHSFKASRVAELEGTPPAE